MTNENNVGLKEEETNTNTCRINSYQKNQKGAVSDQNPYF
jgi:hypothetical protein